jgi:uncharacterized membrane protein YedE/YeeE
MKIVIRALGVILGLSLIGIGIYLNLYQRMWHTHSIGEVILKVIVLLALTLVAALLLAPDSAYRKTRDSDLARSFGGVLSIWGAFSILRACSYLFSHLMDNPIQDLRAKMLFGILAGALVPFASAVVLCARVSMARKSGREQPSQG